MSESQGPAPAPESEKKVPSLRTKVEALIQGSGEDVFEDVAEILSQREISTRKDAIISGLATLEKAEGELAKAEKTQADKLVSERTLNLDGTAATPEVRNWTEAGLKARNKAVKEAQEKVARINKALEDAFGGDFTKLRKINGGGGRQECGVSGGEKPAEPVVSV